MVTQAEIARRAGTDLSTVNKILNRCHAPFKDETVRTVLRVARDMGYDFSRLKYQHRRRHPRKQTEVPLAIKVYTPEGKLHDQGRGVLRDVSLCGALVSAVALPCGTIPLGPCQMAIRPARGALRSIGIRGLPVRFIHAPEGTSVAIEFLSTESTKARRLLATDP